MPRLLLVDKHIDLSLQLESIVLEVLNGLKRSSEERILRAIIPCNFILIHITLQTLTRCHNLIDDLFYLDGSVEGQVNLFAYFRILFCYFGQDADDFVDLLNDLFEN